MGQRRQSFEQEYDERIIDITRVAKVVKGGRRFAFRVTVVVGDNKGRVGVGVGKARSVPDAIRKALDAARKSLTKVPIVGNTVPHEIIGVHGAARVLLKPASPGTGVIAGGPVRAICEMVGIHNILTKIMGSSNPHSVVKATIVALQKLQDPANIARKRGMSLKELYTL